MKTLTDPVKVILRDFCHVEWYEVDELCSIVKSGTAQFDVSLFRSQLEELLLSDSDVPIEEINVLTGNEFGSKEEMKGWLREIWDQVFG